MAVLRLGRRMAIYAGAVAGASVLSGCLSRAQAVSVAAHVLRRSLLLPEGPLFGWRSVIERAWKRSPHTFEIGFQSETAGADATWVDIPGAWATDVTPSLKIANMSPSVLAGYALGAFSNRTGGLGTFPVTMGQLQFYVNQHRLGQLGLESPKVWRWADVEVASQAGSQSGTSGTQVIGWGWGEAETWACLVHGLGGAVLSQDGAFDWQGVAMAVGQLSRLARTANWRPYGIFVPWQGTPQEAPIWEFLLKGFAAYSAGPVFAMMPPWTGRYPSSKPDQNTYVLPDTCRAGGLCSLVPSAFPILPAGDGVPVFGWGLRPVGGSMNSFLLGEFMHWLYEPSQQNALTLEGFLPVASDQSVQEF